MGSVESVATYSTQKPMQNNFDSVKAVGGSVAALKCCFGLVFLNIVSV